MHIALNTINTRIDRHVVVERNIAEHCHLNNVELHTMLKQQQSECDESKTCKHG